MDPICTVVMPLYNREKYIAEAINSVISQTAAQRIRLIITDDCSTDASVKIAEEFQKEHPELISVLYSDKNRGLLANDIRVFENMKTEYFCVLDPDDYWLDNDFLQKALDFLEENRDFVCYSSNTLLIYPNTDKVYAYISADVAEHVTNSIEDYLNKNAIVPHTTAAVYRNSIFKNGIPDFIRNAVGTRSEASFRGDHGRFVTHLKYGKAKFVKGFVGGYRIHPQGIFNGATQFHNDLIGAQSCLDWSAWYDDAYRDKFIEKARPFLESAKNELEKGGYHDEDDVRLYHAISEDIGPAERKEEPDNNAKILEMMANLMGQQIQVQREILWANVFHDTIKGSKWLDPGISFSPGRWAVGYPGLYLLYRVINDTRPASILELGLGESTKLIGSYAKYCKDNGVECAHYVVDHNDEWIEFFSKNNPVDNTNLVKLGIKEVKFNLESIGETPVYMYEGFKRYFAGEKFDLIFIDGPYGGGEFSRMDILDILPDCLCDEFAIVIDDCERIGETRCRALIEGVLRDNDIGFVTGDYSGEKTTSIIASKGVGFLCTL